MNRRPNRPPATTGDSIVNVRFGIRCATASLCLCLALVSANPWRPSHAAETFESRHYALRVVTIAENLEEPWSLAFLPDGRMLVTEQEGRLRIVAADGTVSPPVEGLPKIGYGGQGGLLDVLVDPGFKENRTIYFSFSEPGDGGRGTAVARAVLGDARLSDVKVIFRQVPKSGGGRHFGSRLVMARDGTLFVTVGERGERDRAQDTTVNRGQVIRIHTDGRIPDDNPFVGRDGYRPEIWSYGHRNPQGAALHPVTGKLWIHEHGARGGDEINIPVAGRNYGWPVIAYGRHYWGGQIGEGHEKPGMEQPIHYWDPSIAPSGMAFYTGDKFPEWQGDLLVGALAYQLVARLELDGEMVRDEERILESLDERIRDVRQGPDGFVYLLTDSSDGRILRIEPVR
ncbi:MAG: PQQ-dependent sugar dehydrogenase [Rhodospirillales bacterium]|nr:MAG: PQQ-dependent sugar dehydrogenase [Rhodospirillales bacterium]